MEIIFEPKITKDLIQKIFCLYDENFSPTVKVSHKKLRKRLNEGVYKAIIVKNPDEKYIGLCLFHPNKTLKTLFVDYLCVDKKIQKSGIGRVILEIINDKTKIYKDYQYTILECENYLIPYYEKNLFKKIPLSYPIDNPKPLYLLFKKRTNEENISTLLHMYHKFIQFGLLFNGEIIIHMGLFLMCFNRFLLDQTTSIVKIILNFKSTHT